MAKNDRFVVKHEEGWAVKKTNVGRASSVMRRRGKQNRAKGIVEKPWPRGSPAFV